MPFNECFLGTGCSDGDALVVIDSWETNVGVLDVCTGDNCWIGLTDYPTEGVWEWVQEGANSTYLNWNGGEPNNVGQCGEHCAHIYGGSVLGTWNDENCMTWRPCACEYDRTAWATSDAAAYTDTCPSDDAAVDDDDNTLNLPTYNYDYDCYGCPPEFTDCGSFCDVSDSCDGESYCGSITWTVPLCGDSYSGSSEGSSCIICSYEKSWHYSHRCPPGYHDCDGYCSLAESCAEVDDDTFGGIYSVNYPCDCMNDCPNGGSGYPSTCSEFNQMAYTTTDDDAAGCAVDCDWATLDAYAETLGCVFSSQPTLSPTPNPTHSPTRTPYPTASPSRAPGVVTSVSLSGITCTDFDAAIFQNGMDTTIGEGDATFADSTCADVSSASVSVSTELKVALGTATPACDGGASVCASVREHVLAKIADDGGAALEANILSAAGRRRRRLDMANISVGRRRLDMSAISVESVSVDTFAPSATPTPRPSASPTVAASSTVATVTGDSSSSSSAGADYGLLGGVVGAALVVSACSIAGTIVYKQRKARKAEGPQSFPSAPMHSGAAEVQLVPAGAPAGRQVQV